MNQTTLTKLQYDVIIQKIKEKAIGQHSQKIIEEWLPKNNLATVNKRQAETKEARLILDSQQHVPFMHSNKCTRWRSLLFFLNLNQPCRTKRSLLVKSLDTHCLQRSVIYSRLAAR